jgi:hypothetical protein
MVAAVGRLLACIACHIVEVGYGLPGGSPEDASPLSSQGDLSELGELHVLLFVTCHHLLCPAT